MPTTVGFVGPEIEELVEERGDDRADDRADPVDPPARPRVPASSGPKARAGFIAAPVSGPPTNTSIVIVRPIASPAIALNAPRASTAVAQTAKTRKNVMISSSRTALPSCDVRRGRAPTAPRAW